MLTISPFILNEFNKVGLITIVVESIIRGWKILNENVKYEI
jgi:hypothetical protein